MDPAATAAQVPPALRTKSKAYQTTIAAEADDLKYESKYKELRKKVKIVEEDNDQLFAKILQAQHNLQRLRLERAIIYERVAQLGPPPAPQPAAAPPPQELPAGHQGGQGGHPPHGPPANSGPQPHPLSQSFRAPEEQPTQAPPQTHQRSYRAHPEDPPYPYQQARRHPESSIDEPHYNRSRSPPLLHRRLGEGTQSQPSWDAKQPPPGPNYHPPSRQPADYHPRSNSRDSHGSHYPHDTQQGPPSQLPPIRVQDRRMSIEQPVHGHPPLPSHGQHSGRPSPVTPSFPQANGHSQHIAQSTHRSSTHQGGPSPLANQYPERAGSHSSSASRHESRERHQPLRWEEPRRPSADSPQVEMSPVRFAGDKTRVRTGTGEEGAYGLSVGGSMPSAPGMPRMEREGLNGPPGGAVGSDASSPKVYRRESMMEVSSVGSPDGSISRGQRIR